MLGAQTDTLPEALNAEVKRFFNINLQWFTAIITTGQQRPRPAKGG